MKKIIINADDFGYSINNNQAIQIGYNAGIITSCSLMANMDGFTDAVEKIYPSIPNIDIGFHFNIAEGKCLTNSNLLCDNNGFFNNNYIQLIHKSHNKKFKQQLRDEFKAQIEKILKYCEVTHIDSHVHTHAILDIFNEIIDLAKEYNIKHIRTQNEIPYIVWNKSFNFRFAKNILKNIILNYYTYINKKNNPNICTNDYFIGILYTGFMDENSILKGLKKIKKENSITEIIFHPYVSENISKEKINNYKEFLITQNLNFKNKLINSGFTLSKF